MSNVKQISVFRLIIVLLFFSVTSCGKAYFPIELDTGTSRAQREASQQTFKTILFPMTYEVIKKANLKKYERTVIEVENPYKPAKLMPASKAIKEILPIDNDPGPYIIGRGDEIIVSQILSSETNEKKFVSRTVTVSDQGYIVISDYGRIEAEGLTQGQLEEEIFKRAVSSGAVSSIELSLSAFNSKKIFVNIDNGKSIYIPYTNNPIYLGELISTLSFNEKQSEILMLDGDAQITLSRGTRNFKLSLSKVFKSKTEKIRLFPGDKINIRFLNYRNESILVVGETGAQQTIPINGKVRPTLSDAIFSGGVLNNVTSDFSQVYVLREKRGEFIAYHLDISNPVRMSLAKEFEMRPDDIVFVATQPISLYSRTLSQILGSTGLTLQARDTIRTELGN